MFNFLLQMGPVEKLEDTKGYTPLHFSCFNGETLSSFWSRAPFGIHRKVFSHGHMLMDELTLPNTLVITELVL